MFTLMNSQLAHVALAILSFTAALVGLALGSLTPRPMAGASCGLAVGLLVLCVGVGSAGGASKARMLFPILGTGLALLGGVLSTR